MGSGAITSDAASNLSVGGATDGTLVYSGDYANVYVFNRVLGKAEIQQLQFNPRPLYGAVLATNYWDTQPASMRDLSGNSNDGVAIGTLKDAPHLLLSNFPNLGRKNIGTTPLAYPVIGSEKRSRFTAFSPLARWVSPANGRRAFGRAALVRPLTVS